MSEQEEFSREVRITRAQANTEIEKSEALARLTANPDFKKVIVEGYLEKEAIRLASISATPHWDERRLANVMTDIKAISCLTQFLQKIERDGHLAKQTIEQLDEAGVDEGLFVLGAE